MPVRVVRGRASDPETDREATATLLRAAAEAGRPAVRVWTPPRQLAFGRRDARADGYDAAREAARKRGFPPVERSVGGRAVAYTGTTVAFGHAVPLADARRGLGERYAAAVESVLAALDRLGVDAREGEPPESFCPGQHSIQRDGKLAGVAQRVRTGAALVGGVLVVADDREMAAVLDPVYDALGVPFDPSSVDSVARAGGPADPDPVVGALEAELVGDRERAPERVTDAGDVVPAGR